MLPGEAKAEALIKVKKDTKVKKKINVKKEGMPLAPRGGVDGGDPLTSSTYYPPLGEIREEINEEYELDGEIVSTWYPSSAASDAHAGADCDADVPAEDPPPAAPEWHPGPAPPRRFRDLPFAPSGDPVGRGCEWHPKAHRRGARLVTPLPCVAAGCQRFRDAQACERCLFHCYSRDCRVHWDKLGRCLWVVNLTASGISLDARAVAPRRGGGGKWSG